MRLQDCIENTDWGAFRAAALSKDSNIDLERNMLQLSLDISICTCTDDITLKPTPTKENLD